MPITTAVCNSFKKELCEAKHNFLLSGGDAFKVALYTSSATLGDTTTAYSATNEVSGTGYTAGGGTLTRIDPALDSGTAVIDFADSTWSSSTITARGMLIYNSTNANRAVSVHDFGSNQSSSGGDFTIQFPAAAAATAIVRIA